MQRQAADEEFRCGVGVPFDIRFGPWQLAEELTRHRVTGIEGSAARRDHVVNSFQRNRADLIRGEELVIDGTEASSRRWHGRAATDILSALVAQIGGAEAFQRHPEQDALGNATADPLAKGDRRVAS